MYSVSAYRPKGAISASAAELDNYWSTIGPIFALNARRKKELGNSVLHSDVLSQHAKILAIAKEVSALNDDELKEAERRIAEVFAQFRHRLLMVATIAFSFGLILAAITIMYAKHKLAPSVCPPKRSMSAIGIYRQQCRKTTCRSFFWEKTTNIELGV
jgi:hypothetical protein